MTTRRYIKPAAPETVGRATHSDDSAPHALAIDADEAMRAKLQSERARRALLDIDDYIELN